MHAALFWIDGMNAVGAPRFRRNFFAAPVWLAALAGVLMLAFAWTVWRSATTTTFVLLRHAEKQLGSIEDPPLSSDGEARAQRLAELLGGAQPWGKVTAVYASDTRRAEQTATPLAQRLGLPLERYVAKDSRALIGQALRVHAGGVILIVGHSNTVPLMVDQASGGQFKPESKGLAEDDFGTIFVVTAPRWAPAALLRLHY